MRMASPDQPTRGRPCRICGGNCTAFPDLDHLSTYPFLPGGRDPLFGKQWIIAPHRIVADGRVLYGTGDRVPIDDAVRYGLIDPPDQPAPAEPIKPRPKGKRRPAEDRAHKPEEDR